MKSAFMKARPALAAVTLLVATTSASAQEGTTSTGGFGERAQNVIVLDSAAGFTHFNVSDKDGENGNPSDLFGVFAFPPITRLGYHRFFGALSLGAGLHWSETDVALGGLGGSSTMYGFAPRIGYAAPLSPTFAIWVRGGISMTYISQDKTDRAFIGPGAELFGVFTPIRNFGITFGPVGEYGIIGKQGGGPQLRLRSYGLTAGLLVDF